MARVYIFVGRFTLLLILVSLWSCTVYTDAERRLVAEGDLPFSDRMLIRQELSANGDITIVEKRSFWGSVNFYAERPNSAFFLLNMDALDSGENLTESEWIGDYFVFFITNSARFPGTTRLALYLLSEEESTEVLDEKMLGIESYSVIGNSIEYIDKDGGKHTVPLDL